LLPTDCPDPDKVFYHNLFYLPRDEEIVTRIIPAGLDCGLKWVTVDSQAKLVHTAEAGE
jgi:hypothetical protein